MNLLRNLLCAVSTILFLMLFADSVFALPVGNQPELYVMGKIQNQGYINWGFNLHFTAYNTKAVPASYFVYQQRDGEFRVATAANTEQMFDLRYQTITSIDGYGPMHKIDQILCRFNLQVNQQGLTRLSVNTLDNSYVKCSVSQDAEGKWIITLTNPADIS